MHVRSSGPFAKRIRDFRSRLANPAAVMRVFPIIYRGPADARGLQIFVCGNNALRDLRHEKRRVDFVEPRAKAAHCRRRGMRVRRRDHHAIHRNAALLAREFLGFINQGLRHHAGVHDGERDLRLSVIEHKAAYIQAVGEFVGSPFKKSPRDDARKIRWRNVRRRNSHPECVGRTSATGKGAKNKGCVETFDDYVHFKFLGLHNAHALRTLYHATIRGELRVTTIECRIHVSSWHRQAHAKVRRLGAALDYYDVLASHCFKCQQIG